MNRFRGFHSFHREQLIALRSMVLKLKQEFVAFPRQVGWTVDPNPGSAPAPTQGQGSRPCLLAANAAQGNFLEAINVTLNVLEKHYMDRDLSRTGNESETKEGWQNFMYKSSTAVVRIF